MHLNMRTKRASTVLEKAEKRASAMMSIEEDLDLGNGLTLAAYWAEIDAVREKQVRYNASRVNSADSFQPFSPQGDGNREQGRRMKAEG